MRAAYGWRILLFEKHVRLCLERDHEASSCNRDAEHRSDVMERGCRNHDFLDELLARQRLWPGTCVTTTTTGSGSEAASQRQLGQAEERQLREAKEARIRKWEDYCKPTGYIDDMGITLVRYAHPGCDLGRSGDGSMAQAQ
jgi:hypothetical protein